MCFEFCNYLGYKTLFLFKIQKLSYVQLQRINSTFFKDFSKKKTKKVNTISFIKILKKSIYENSLLLLKARFILHFLCRNRTLNIIRKQHFDFLIEFCQRPKLSNSSIRSCTKYQTQQSGLEMEKYIERNKNKKCARKLQKY